MNTLAGILRYFTTEQIAWYHAELGRWSRSSKSHLKNASKLLRESTEAGEIEKLPHCYRLKGLTGQGDEHALAVTDELLNLLVTYPDSQLYRELSLPFGRRPDILALLIKDQQYQALILEVEIGTSELSIHEKIRDYTNHAPEVCEQYQILTGIKPPFFKLCFATSHHLPPMKGVECRTSFSTSARERSTS